MATATHEHEPAAYHGPERRISTREERASFLRSRKVRRDILNWIGRGAIGAALLMASFWVGRVERHIETGDEAMRVLAATVKTVETIATTQREMLDRERAATSLAAADKTAVLVELQKLNGQVEALRIESQARVVHGSRRDP